MEREHKTNRGLCKTALLPPEDFRDVIGRLKSSHMVICYGSNLPLALTLNKIAGFAKPSYKQRR